MGVSHFCAFAQQDVCLVENQNHVTPGGALKDTTEVLFGLTALLRNDRCVEKERPTSHDQGALVH